MCRLCDCVALVMACIINFSVLIFHGVGWENVRLLFSLWRKTSFVLFAYCQPKREDYYYDSDDVHYAINKPLNI